VYWAPESPHIHVDKAINLSGLDVWCEINYKGLIWPFFLEEIVIGLIMRYP
jgi:hypothetical protein